MRIYNFSKVVGNVSTVKLMQTALKRNTFPKFTILSGIPGTGKSTCAEIAGLTLTCQNPNNGEPCLMCKSCKQNLQALKTTGESKNLIKKNLGILNSRKDVLDLIKEIFVLQTPIGNNVYILEEAHSLEQSEQTALLEEIDRLDNNTFIILCTTKQTKLLPELRSRAINFTFNRLNDKESKLLFDRCCISCGITKTTSSVASMVIRYAKGVPRDLTNIVEFISKNEATEEDIATFLNCVDTSLFTELLENMNMGLQYAISTMDYICSSYPIDVITEQFKNYFSDVMFLILGDIAGPFNTKEKKLLKSFLTPSIVLSIAKQLETLHYNNLSDSDLKMTFIKIAQIINKKKVSDIYKENSRNASEQNVSAESLNKELVKDKINAENVEIKTLTSDSFRQLSKQFGNSKSVVQSQQAKPVINTEDSKQNDSNTKELHVFGGE